jgi:alpha-amylase
MGVIMQAFYWNCPQGEGRTGAWWTELSGRLTELKRVGFTALWLPPAAKAFDTGSMGYDVYDYYDLGDYPQKGGTATLYGTGAELRALIAEAHAAPGLQVYADVVFNHNSGADGQERNPIDGQLRWTRFDPASGRFRRDWTCFHPCAYESWDGYQRSGDMPDLCHRNPRVYGELMEYARWLVEEVGIDGFRYDMVKGYGAWVVGAIQEYRYRRGGTELQPRIFGVAEYWDGDTRIEAWLDEATESSDNPVSAFDFDLRNRLKALCDGYGYDLRGLAAPGVLYLDRPGQAVTFVESHDLAEPHENPNPIYRAKMLAYAFILTHEGYPCVFWKDYFTYGLGLEGWASGIAALVQVHERDAMGPTDVLYADHDLYVMQRRGLDGRGGLVFVLNNRGDGWNGRTVQTAFTGRRLVPAAWRGEQNADVPQPVWTDAGGSGPMWAPPRGYAVYRPE